jgi:hypothetical protein
MKYTKKLYYADFASAARIVRPRNQVLRTVTDTLLAPWYIILFLAVCAVYPTAIFADSFRFMKLQLLRLSNENMRKGLYHDLSKLSIGNWRHFIAG